MSYQSVSLCYILHQRNYVPRPCNPPCHPERSGTPGVGANDTTKQRRAVEPRPPDGAPAGGISVAETYYITQQIISHQTNYVSRPCYPPCHPERSGTSGERANATTNHCRAVEPRPPGGAPAGGISVVPAYRVTHPADRGRGQALCATLACFALIRRCHEKNGYFRTILVIFPFPPDSAPPLWRLMLSMTYCGMKAGLPSPVLATISK